MSRRLAREELFKIVFEAEINKIGDSNLTKKMKKKIIERLQD